MPDIVTLTINPAIDIFVNVARVEPTRKLRCSAPKRDPGGGGINVARVAHRLGGSVAAIYPTGGAIGKLLNRLVEREGIDSLVTPSHVETRENFTAYEETTGEQYRFVLPGSALHRAEWEAVLAQADDAAGETKIRGCQRQRPARCSGRLLRTRRARGQAARRAMHCRHFGTSIEGGACARRCADQTEPRGAFGPLRDAARDRRRPGGCVPEAGSGRTHQSCRTHARRAGCSARDRHRSLFAHSRWRSNPSARSAQATVFSVVWWRRSPPVSHYSKHFVSR